MAKIDTSGWREFRVGDLFTRLELKFIPDRKFIKASDVSLDKTEEYSLPLVNAKHSNNGIMYYGRPDEWESEEMTIDIVADGAASTGDVYPQPQRTGVLYNAYLIKPIAEQLTEYDLMFLSTVIQRCVKNHFGYDNKCTWDRLQDEMIKLPVTDDGKPDFVYMDAYMRKIMKESETSLKSLRRSDKSKTTVDTIEWKEFVVGDLFTKLSLGIKNPNFNKALDVSEVRTEEFNIPLVNAKHGNNGIMYYGRETDFETAAMTIDIVQNGAIATGDVYPQPQKTGVLWDAYLVKPNFEVRNERTLVFLAAVLEKAIKDKFSYDNKCIWDKASLLTVSLPANKDGVPDVVYMDRYMSEMLDTASICLDALAKVAS